MKASAPPEFASLSTPVWRASTVVFPDLQAFAARRSQLPDGFTYGTTGTPTQRALEQRIAALEDAAHCVVLPSGQAAICTLMLCLLGHGDHLLVTDAVYGPVRSFATTVLARMGVEVEFFDPAARSLEDRFTERTRLVWLENPGSITLEIADARVIAAEARRRGIVTALDGTWATSLGMRPLALGVDAHVQAATKYIGGHSDVLMGAISTNDRELYRRLREMQGVLGQAVGADDCFLVLRGLETLSLRLQRQFASTLAVAQRLSVHPFVRRTLYPPLPVDAHHDQWRRDFTAGGCVVTVQLASAEQAAHEALFSTLRRFPLGASWGGVHSLAAFYPPEDFALRQWNRPQEPLVRISVGLEDPELLTQDLEQALDAACAATRSRG